MGELPNRIHITGASGGGTTTFARAISDRFGHRHIDTDDYDWLPSTPPFTTKRPQQERVTRLRSALTATETWVLSGSLCGWGDELIPEFELVVYLLTPTPFVSSVYGHARWNATARTPYRPADPAMKHRDLSRVGFAIRRWRRGRPQPRPA